MNTDPQPQGSQNDLTQVWPPIVDLESMFQNGATWPPRSESKRLTCYKEDIALRENRFNDCWSNYNRLMREDSRKELTLYLGYFWLSTKKSLDMLLGKPPLIAAADKKSQENQLITDFVEATDFPQVLYEVAADMDSCGDGVFKIYKDTDDQVKIQSNSPDIWFPVVKPGNLREYQYHVLADIFHKVEQDEWGENKSKAYYLKVEIHNKEQIEHRVYALDTAIRTGMTYTGMAALGMSYTIQEQMNIKAFEDLFPTFQGLPSSGIEQNPLNEFLVIPVPGPRTSKEVYGRSSYGADLKSVAKALIEEYIQREQVLTKHFDPNLIGPKGMFDSYDPVTQKVVMRFGGKYLSYRWDPGMTPPDVHYLEFAQLKAYMDAVQQDINDLTQKFLNLAEIPPAVLAGSEGQSIGARVSGVAYRLMLTPLTDKVQRMTRSLQPRALHTLNLAMELNGTHVDTAVIQFPDPSPKIPLEEAQRVASLFLGKIISRAQSLRELNYSDEQVIQIQKEIEDESQSSQIPSISSPTGVTYGSQKDELGRGSGKAPGSTPQNFRSQGRPKHPGLKVE